MKEEKTIEEKLRDLRISKDDPEVLRKRIEELENKVQELEHEKMTKQDYESTRGLGSNEKICQILRRKTGDGIIEVVNGRVVCEYSRIVAEEYIRIGIPPWSWKTYGVCMITEATCPYVKMEN